MLLLLALVFTSATAVKLPESFRTASVTKRRGSTKSLTPSQGKTLSDIFASDWTRRHPSSNYYTCRSWSMYDVLSAKKTDDKVTISINKTPWFVLSKLDSRNSDNNNTWKIYVGVGELFMSD